MAEEENGKEMAEKMKEEQPSEGTEVDATVKKRPLEEEDDGDDGQPEKRPKTEESDTVQEEAPDSNGSNKEEKTKEVDANEVTEKSNGENTDSKPDDVVNEEHKSITTKEEKNTDIEDSAEKMEVDEVKESSAIGEKENIENEDEKDNETKSEQAMEIVSINKDDKNDNSELPGDESEKGEKEEDTSSKEDAKSEEDAKSKEESGVSEDKDVKSDKVSAKPGDKLVDCDEAPMLAVSEDKNGKSDDGSVHSEDSEKENVRVEMPMDLSTKTSSKSSTPAQDTAMLSDESDADDLGIHRRQKNIQMDIKMDEVKLRQKMIKRLQAELRNEEAKLVLLKKLRVSQMSHQIQNNIPPGKGQQSNQHQSQPPPLVRGGNQAQQQQLKQSQSQPPQLSRPGSQPPQNGNKSQGPPPLVMAPRMDQRQLIQNQMKMLQQQQQQQASNNRPSTNALANYRSSQSQSDAMRQMQQAQNRAPEETPAQRQAAAKLALRKQLEKTLLQIPPPKPPPPEMNFIPNLASPDFVYLLGLEEAVNHIIDTNLISKGRKNPDEKMVCNPFTCVQCNTDFTPVWKREKPGSKNVICEQCVTTNQKKALKQEHTNRLKSAFVKALQQEQEIERMQSQEAKSNPPSSSASTTSTPKESKSESQRERDSSRDSSRESPVTTSRNSSQAYKESMAESIRQHHNLLQAHQAAALRMGQPLGMQGFNPRAPFPYQLPFAARASDLQRQYLLDMIPKGGLPWNS